MRILSLPFIYIAVASVHGYGAAWLDLPPPHVPSFERPVDVVTDVINELGVRILQEYGEIGQSGNVAFSPTGIGFVLAALYEGSAGVGNEQIAHVLGLPRDKDVTRIGLRDIHRRLRSYLSPDGFLGGLTLNRENTKLRPEYEEVLKFLGFDLPSGDDGSNATESSTSFPERTTELTSTLEPSTNPPTTTETESETTPQESTSPVMLTSRITEDVTTMKIETEETTEATTIADVVKDTSTEPVSDPPTTKTPEEVSPTVVPTTEVTTTTTEPPTTVLEMSAKLTEASSAKPLAEERTEPISSTQSTTVATATDAPITTSDKPEAEEITTLNSVGVTEAVKSETTTSQPEETTMSMVGDATEEPNVQEKTETETEVEMSTLDAEESVDETTTTTTVESTTLEPQEETVSNEIVSESTTVGVDTTTIGEVETLLSMENKNLTAGMTNVSSPLDMKAPERRTVRKIGIRDSVVRTLLDARSADPEIKLTARSEFVKSKKNRKGWIDRVDEYSVTERNEDSMNSKRSTKMRGRRNSQSYFAKFPDFPSFPIYPDFPGVPEETSWTRHVGGWRVHSPKTEDSSRDVTELSFLVNGELMTSVPAATYTVVLPFAFLPTLQALALEFPLDDPRYNILLLLPTDEDGTRRLAKDLGNVGLRELRKELQPAWVRAMIPSFMLKGFVTLTPFLQRLGIRDVFEPRDADLTPMTDDEGVYARDVQQSIGVNIRNYMKPDRTHSRNGLFERAGPVSFVAVHPFLFFIIDAETGVSLIAGRIEDPLNSRIL